MLVKEIVGAIVVVVIGIAAQRGNTCAVSAFDEALRLRRWKTLHSIFDVVLCVAGLYAALHLTHVLTLAPVHSFVTWRTFLGGALLGVGVCINGACAVGTIARLGSGDFAFFATPIGVFTGCVLVVHTSMATLPATTTQVGLTNQLAGVVLVLAIAVFLYRAFRGGPALLREEKIERLVRQPWNPRTAATVIGVCFIILAASVGPWSYTDFLYHVAKGGFHDEGFLAFLSLLLFLGAILGGRLTHKWHVRPFEALDVARCFIGGVVLGFGLCWIPGANDGLTIGQVPLLIPSAMVAMIVLFATIAVVMWLGHEWQLVISATHRDHMRAERKAQANSNVV